MSGSSSNTRVTDVCELELSSTGSSSRKKKYTLVYVLVPLGVICAFCVIAVAAILRKWGPGNNLRHTLSSYVGPNGLQSTVSQPFLPEHGYGDDELGNRSGQNLLDCQILDEMDKHMDKDTEVNAASLDHEVMIADQVETDTVQQQTQSADDAFVDSMNADHVADQVETATLPQQTQSADDAFIDSTNGDQEASSSIQRLASIPEIGNLSANDRFSL